MIYRSPLRISCLVLGFRLGLTGCAGLDAAGDALPRHPGAFRPGALGAPPAAPPVTVEVSYPVEREVTDYADFTARMAAVDSVEVRRVGVIWRRSTSRKGLWSRRATSFLSSTRGPTRPMYDRAKANLAQAEAHLARALARFPRAEELLPRGDRPADYDMAKGDRDEAAAAVEVAEAALNTGAAQPGFHQGHSPDQRARQPIPRHGGQLDSVGGPGQRHPADDHRVGGPDVRLLRRGRAHRAARPAVIREGKAESAGEPGCPCAGPGHRGRVSPPGHDQFRGQPGQSENRHLACPGRVSQQGRGALRPASSPASVCPSAHPTRPCWSPTAPRHGPGPEDPLRRQRQERGGLPPRSGRALHDGLRAIEDGLKPGERVIVNGLQAVRPGITVEPKLVDMPRQIRNPKLEIRNRSKCPDPNDPSHEICPRLSFVIRIRCDSDFGFLLRGLSCWRVSSSTARSWPG